MKKVIKLICFFFFIIFSFSLTSCQETINPLDYILNYDIVVNPLQDGSLDMTYHIKWKVLDDTSEGPLEWVKIGVANKYVDRITSLSDTIDSVYYYSDDGAYIRVDFKKKYYKNEIVDFSFSLRQSRFFTLEDDHVNYQFITGWFDKIQVEKATLSWKADGIIYHNAKEVKDGYLYYEYFLDYGKSIELVASYERSYFSELDETKGYSHQYRTKEDYAGMTFFIIFLVIFGAVFIISIIKKDFSSEQYQSYRGFVNPRRIYNNHHYLYVHHYVSYDTKGNRIVNSTSSSSSFHSGSGCACACACACAGGGRAGCTRKDFYDKTINIKQLKDYLK